MGIDRNNGIQQTVRKVNDFNKKQASGKDTDADQAKIFSVSARLSEARSKLQNARSQSQGQGLVYLDSPQKTAKKENSDAQVKVPPPSAAVKQDNQTAKFQAEALQDIDSLEADKASILTRIDAAVIENSGESIGDLREEFTMIDDALETSKDHKNFLDNNDLGTKDPDLLEKIQNKKNEILSLTFDKSKKPELALARQELDQLKAQLFSQ